MKKALKEVLGSLGSQEQSHLHRLVLKAHLNLGSYPCSGDCDRKLARINLCPYCKLEEQVFAPILEALEEIKEVSQMAVTPVKECPFCGEEFTAGDGVPEGDFECCCSEECYENLKYEY